MVRVRSVQPLRDFVVGVEFTDGSRRDIDLEPYLHGPIFESLRQDPEEFRNVRVDAELGTLVWDNGADIDPDVLYVERQPAWTEREARK